MCYADEYATIEEFTVDAALPDGRAGHSLWCVSEYRGFSVLRLSAFRYPLQEDVELDDEEYSVEVWARDEAEALSLGVERIERFKADQGS